jgi:cold shock CspA family protein
MESTTSIANVTNATSDRVFAVIVSWFTERGFGFAHRTTDGETIERYFVHISQCNKLPKLGDLVALSPRKGRNGCYGPVGWNVVVQDAPSVQPGGAL